MPNPLASNINVYATIDNTVTNNDNSPVFSNLPVPFVCLGQQFCYSHGAFDADGDSIVYELIPPRGGGGAPLTYLPGFSAQQPLTTIPAMTFNTETGDFCFTPQMMEVTVMAVLVKEYRNGVLIGSVERDIQVTVINCSNVLPQASGINGTNSFSITACADQLTCFTINSSDTDSAQNVTMDWDNSIPGASFTTSSGSRPTATFCWTPSQADIGSSRCFTASVIDDACPIYGLQTYTYCIDVQGPRVDAGPDVDLGCGGPSTTALNAIASNGTAGSYAYQWSTGATTPGITVGPGTYVVSVTSAGCTSHDTVVVNPPLPPPTASFSANSPCQGVPVIFNNTTSSTANITRTRWDFGGGNLSSAANPTYTFPAAGTYNVTLTVTASNGCTSTFTGPVNVLPPPVVVMSPPVSACAGQPMTLSASGGVSYTWSPGGLNGSSVSVSPAQSQQYQVVVTGASGCTATGSVQVTINPLPDASANSQPARCAGSSDGSVAVQVTGGTSPYSYQWNTGSAAAIVSGLPSGSYSVLVTDAAGCTASASVNVTAPAVLALTPASVPPLCQGASNGSVSVSASGGTAPFNYLWSSGGATASTVNQLPSGSYPVTVTDANGCSASVTVVIQDPAPIVLSPSSSPSTCGASDGSVAVSVSGGNSSYQYLWSPGNSTSSSVTGLVAGNYTVTVTDGNGCTASAIISLPSTNAPAFSPSVLQDVSCSAGSDGSVQVGQVSGNPPFTYLWSNGSTAAVVSGITAGNYSVTVTDVNGCVSMEMVVVQEPPPLALVVSPDDASCYGASDGSAIVVASGGTAGYSYLWSAGSSTGTQSTGLVAGNYGITVTDANGCTAMQSFQISEPPSVQVAVSAFPVSCNGGADGVAYLSSTVNAISPVQANWSNGVSTSDTLSGIPSGVYDVVVTDQRGCTATASTTVNEPAPLSLQLAGVDPACNGFSNGSVSSSLSGGTPGYSLQWSTGVSNTSSLSGLAVGFYSVILTDANGCTVSASIQLNEPSVLTVSTASTPATCGVSDGTATASSAGGTAPYQYAWTSGAGAASQAVALPSGSYSVTVTDAHGCTASSGTSISNIGAPQLNAATLQDVSCHGGSDGIAAPVALTGNAPFSYSWSNGSNSDTLRNVSAGGYLLTITDVNGCQTSDSVSIIEPPQLSAAVVVTPATCNGSADASATAQVAGGSPAYTYSWSNGSTSGQSVNGLSAGNYNLTVTDINGCTVGFPFSISEPLPILLAAAVDSVSCYGSAHGMASIAVTNGYAPFTFNWGSIASNNDTVAGLLAGTYNVTLLDDHGCTGTASMVVPGPALLNATVSSSPVSCHGGSNGFATVFPSGGNQGYAYSWSTGNSGSSVSGLTAGNYSVIVTDRNGCTVTANSVVQEPSPLSVISSSTPATCGVADGSATASPNGGTAPYAYEWSPVLSTSQSVNGLYAGSYGVIVTDANGCTQASGAQVPNTGAPVFSASVIDDVSCSGGSDGIAVVQNPIGNPPFTFQWSNGAVGDTVWGLSASAYIVRMIDVNGCETSDSIEVFQPSPLAVNLVSQAVSCNGGSDGSASVAATGGTPGYSWQWSPGGALSATVNGLQAGVYDVVVTDANGCTTTSSTTVTEPPQIQLASQAIPARCHGSSDGFVSVSGAGGTGSLIYQWSPGGVISDSLIGLPAGIYTVVATDQNGCTSMDNVVVNEPTALEVIVAADSVSCSGDSDGSLQAMVTGGTSGYQYLWSPMISTSSQLNGIPAGIYQVTVTDANGCTSTTSSAVIDPMPLSLSVGIPPVLCIGQSAILSANGSGGTQPLSFAWSTGVIDDSVVVSPLATTSYNVTLSDANGCSLQPQGIIVVVHPPLSVSVSDPESICEGENVMVSSTAGGGDGGPYTYSWNGNSITTASAIVAPVSDSTFIVTVSDGCSPDVSASVTIDVNPLPDVQFTPQQFVGCSPVAVDLSNVFQVPPGSAFAWDLDEELSSQTNPSHTYVTPGYYDISLSITTPEGCTDQDTVRNAVHVYGYPTAAFQQSTESVSIFTPSVELDDRSVDAVAWSWDFGDGTTLFGEQHPIHTYSDSGTYTIRLIVTNEGGCPDTIYGVVRIEPEFTIFIPNAFTPNGDGRNDFFFPVGENIVSIEMWILDRWGLEIFHSTSFELQWDGSYKSNQRPCQNDVYEYVVDAMDLTGRKRRYIGHVSLVR